MFMGSWNELFTEKLIDKKPSLLLEGQTIPVYAKTTGFMRGCWCTLLSHHMASYDKGLSAVFLCLAQCTPPRLFKSAQVRQLHAEWGHKWQQEILALNLQPEMSVRAQ